MQQQSACITYTHAHTHTLVRKRKSYFFFLAANGVWNREGEAEIKKNEPKPNRNLAWRCEIHHHKWTNKRASKRTNQSHHHHIHARIHEQYTWKQFQRKSIEWKTWTLDLTKNKLRILNNWRKKNIFSKKIETPKLVPLVFLIKTDQLVMIKWLFSWECSLKTITNSFINAIYLKRNFRELIIGPRVRPSSAINDSRDKHTHSVIKIV